MVDVNEEIVRKYFESKSFFVQTNVQYLERKEETGKKSSGYGDIDLIVSNPKKYDVLADLDQRLILFSVIRISVVNANNDSREIDSGRKSKMPMVSSSIRDSQRTN